ncbi:MAG: hypothetical protein ABWY00_00530 [Dongiaceae bacterium]
MLDILSTENFIAPMSEAAIGKVRALETRAAQLPQEPIATAHLFHAGLYARSIVIPAGVMITGTLIKIPTILIISGDVVMYVDGQARELRGYNVFAASARRKQAFVALTDVSMTMLFQTRAKTVAAAEDEFTGEADLLLSRRDPGSNTVTVTGE